KAEMAGEQALDFARQLDARGGEHDQVIANALEVRDEVRGQHNADALLGDHLHEVLEEFAPGEWVERGDGLVEDEQLRPLRDCQGERELRALTPGQFPCPLVGVEPELRYARLAEFAVPARVEV